MCFMKAVTADAEGAFALTRRGVGEWAHLLLAQLFLSGHEPGMSDLVGPEG